jgi:hypothetical protein
MSATDIIAIYAAVVATGVLLWDVYKWRRTERVRLVGRIATGMIITDAAYFKNQSNGPSWIMLNIDNRGHIPCTVTHLYLISFKNLYEQMRERGHSHMLVNTDGSRGNSVPHFLEPGRSFMGLAMQTPDVENRSRTDRLHIAIVHSGADKPLLYRIRPIQTEPKIPA